MRILAGVGAWLLGAGTATASSVLVVSLLGQGIAASSTGQQLTAADVTQALAREAHETSGASGAVRPMAHRPVPTRSATRTPATQPPVVQTTQAGATPSATPAASQPPAAPPSPQAAGGTVLTSQGGTVLAECQSAGAYLVSWSPTQGYEANSVIRGPAATARVTFMSYANSVTMVVSCPGGPSGTPTATSSVLNYGGGGGGTEE